jgi:AcrR family transcriptional regulator
VRSRSGETKSGDGDVREPLRQAEKSKRMRTAILEAATTYIAIHGYTRATLAIIAEEAGVSRGAITHHYPSKVALAVAVVEHIFLRRMTVLLKQTRALTEKQRVEQNLAVERLWESHESREYKAYLQLNTAALTDPDLLEVFVPKVQQQEAIWATEINRVFHEWDDNAPALWVSADLLKTVLDGMVLNRHIWNDPRREATLRALTAAIIVQLRDRKIALPTEAEIRRFHPAKPRAATRRSGVAETDPPTDR